MWSSVAALGATGFAGAQLKQWEGNQLAAIGGYVKSKAQRMPFKMFLGVKKAREVRAARADEEARLSGVVRPRGAGKAAKGRKVREREHAPDEPVPYTVRGSVMRADR